MNRWIRFLVRCSTLYGDDKLVDKLLQSDDVEKAMKEYYSDYNEKRDKFRHYWNNINEKADIKYKRWMFTEKDEVKPVDIDVRIFIQQHDARIENRLDEEDLYVDDPMKIDDIVPWIYGEAQEFYDYKYDSKDLGYSEYWKFPFQTMEQRKGDCEDHACKIISFLRAAGVPAWRVRNVCGITNTGGGHSTVYVLGDDMETWYHINSTSTTVHDSLTEYPEWGDENDGIGIDPDKVWFSFNDKHSWKDFGK